MPAATPTAPPSARPATGRALRRRLHGWLTQGVRSRKLIINDAKALVHTVAGTAYLVSPGVFQRYAQEHPGSRHCQAGEAGGMAVGAEALREVGAHIAKQPSGLNIWTCDVTGPRKSRRLRLPAGAARGAIREVPPDNLTCASPTRPQSAKIPQLKTITTRGDSRRPSPGRLQSSDLRELWFGQFGLGQGHQVGRTAFQRTGDFEDQGAVWVCARLARSCRRASVRCRPGAPAFPGRCPGWFFLRERRPQTRWLVLLRRLVVPVGRPL